MINSGAPNKSIDVSIIVPAYNAEGTIKHCLEALANQVTDCRYEIIFVDDGSNDNSYAIAEESGAIVIRHQEKSGAGAARNSGINEANGEIICFTDADCAPKSDWIEQMLISFKNPEIIGAKGTYATKQREVVARFVQIEYEDKYDLLKKQELINFIDTYSAAYRRQVLLANDGFDEQVFYVEDQELSFRLAARGYQMVFQPQATVYHQHSNTILAYFRKKFMIGYWKAQILRRFPNRAIQDSHTPQVLKVQLLLLAFTLTSLLGLFITTWSFLLVAVGTLLFIASTVPFLNKAWSKDKIVFLASPFLLVIRAAALGFGYAWGLIKPSRNIRKEHTIHGLNYLIKRFGDILGSIIGLVFTVIFGPFIALAIKIDSTGPVIFKQERIGEEGRPFTLYKFRSMFDHADEALSKVVDLSNLEQPVFKHKDDPRLTKVGRLLRRWSLDEMPQFWNVLKGDMSLVGPRPEETQFVEMYNDWQRRRLSVKPGITGPMQVSGRGDLPLNARVDLELDYINNYSLKRDLVIIFKTLPAIIRGSGAH